MRLRFNFGLTGRPELRRDEELMVARLSLIAEGVKLGYFGEREKGYKVTDCKPEPMKPTMKEYEVHLRQTICLPARNREDAKKRAKEYLWTHYPPFDIDIFKLSDILPGDLCYTPVRSYHTQEFAKLEVEE